MKNEIKKIIKCLADFYRPSREKIIILIYASLVLGLGVYYFSIYRNSCFNNDHLLRCETDWLEVVFSSIFIYPFFILGQSFVLLLLYIYTLTCVIAIIITKIKRRYSKEKRKNNRFIKHDLIYLLSIK